MLLRFYAGKRMAPQVGFEPTTLRLTAECSTIELLRSVVDRALRIYHSIPGCGLKTVHFILLV
jgi:hypothetical protein